MLETNITNDLSIITTDYFIFPSKKNGELKCLFKKTNNQKDDKLLLLCKPDSPGEYELNMDAVELDNINILYSFKIAETHISEKVKVLDNEGAKILSVYPDSLDFNSQDKFTIKYQTENPEKLIGIKLNNNSNSELECKDKTGFKECIVPQNHFNEPGYYYTYYNNSLGDKVISYEIQKIQITLKKPDESGKENSKKTSVGLIVGCVLGGVGLIAIIVVVVICIKRKKDNSSEINSSKIGNILPNSAQVELVERDNFGD